MYSDINNNKQQKVTNSLKDLIRKKQLKTDQPITLTVSQQKNFNTSLKTDRQQWNKKTLSHKYFEKRHSGSQGRISNKQVKVWNKVPQFLKDERSQQLMQKMGLENNRRNPQKKIFFGEHQKKIPQEEQTKRNKRTSLPSIPNFQEKKSEQQTNDSPKSPSLLTHISISSNFMKKKYQSDEKYTTSFSKSFSKDSSPKKQLFSCNKSNTEGEFKNLTIHDFESIKNLGSGKYGKVFLARHKFTNFIGAIKIVEKKLILDQNIVEQFIRELKIQNFLNHPNIVRLYGFFDDQVNIYVLLEACMGGQLFKKLKRDINMSEKKAASIMKQVCSAVGQLHANEILHRDIKPENIVLHENIIKICDFGWSTFRENKLRSTFCGTPLYVCPQILKGDEYDEKIDIWSLGVMAYEMLVGQNPFKICKQQDLMKIVKDQIIFPTNDSVSKDGIDFLQQCLSKKPQNRWSIRQLQSHPFIQKVQEKKIKL